MDKSPVCTCLMKQDLEEAADPYEFLDENYSIPGILDNLDKLSQKRIEMRLLPVWRGVAERLQEEKKNGGRG